MTKVQLPEDFQNQMKTLLQDEFDTYVSSFDMSDEKGLYYHNRISASNTALPAIASALTPIHGIHGGYYNTLESVGHHPYHHAGTIYSQDPGAMCVAGALSFAPYAKVLDLCAAPGGKSTQIASLLENIHGVLVSNEPHPSRNQILCSNIERMGFTNVLVTKLLPEELALYYPSYFDAVLVDAPCSGEGMFRKYPESIQEWSLENVNKCVERQKSILDSAITMLKPGGQLIYSTCTYNEQEDDEIVRYLMETYNLQAGSIPSEIKSYLSSNPHYTDYASFSGRFYPHKNPGEGQFMAYLTKSGNYSAPKEDFFLPPLKKINDKERKLIMESFGNSIDLTKESLYKFKEDVIIYPSFYPKLPAKGIAYSGVIVGSFSKNRFVPHHNFFHCYGNWFKNTVNLQADDINLQKYLRGEEIIVEDVKPGYGALLCEGTPLGGYKASNGRLKNHYPKGLRNP